MSKPIGKQRPKPPPYPRPVPHFVVEELPPAPQDLAWNALNGGTYYSSDGEDAQDAATMEQRAAKRRKIEACATAYLRGESLYIMSAQLKGPFKEGWRNPWAKRNKKPAVDTVADVPRLEVPETTKKVLSSFAQEEQPIVVPVATPVSRPTSRESQRGQLGTKPIAIENAPSPFTSRVQNLPKEPSPKVPKQAKERRVEEWLRTNDAFAKTSEILVHSSPTPIRRNCRTPGQSQGTGNVQRASQSEPPRMLSPIHRTPKSATSFQAGDSKSFSKKEGLIHELSRHIQNIVSEPIVQPADELHAEVRKLAVPPSSSKSVQDESRAEFEILKNRRSTLQTVPAIAHMSPFEFRKVPVKSKIIEDSFKMVEGNAEQVTDNNGTVTDVPATLPQEQHGAEHDDMHPVMESEIASPAAKQVESEAIAEPKLQLDNNVNATAASGEQVSHVAKSRNVERTADIVGTNISKPALSTAVSDISTADMLPSAQPKLELVRSLSGAFRDDKLLSMKQVTNGWDNTEGHEKNTKAILGTRSAPENGGMDMTIHQGQQNEQLEGDVVDIVQNSTPVPNNRAVELNTQEMLANIEPLDLSTIKKPRGSTKKDTPVTATKTKSDRKRKKASFAIEPSSTPTYNSIQDVMKAKISKNLGSPPLFVLGKDDLSIIMSDEENEPQHKRPRRVSNAGKPKSILKSTNPVSSPSSLRRSKSGLSTGQEQDGQQGNMIPIGSGQNAIGEDTFDLDAAIDDLGSFLGTWDADKEASSLDIEL